MRQDNELVEERYELAIGRIAEIVGEDAFGEPLSSFFKDTSSYVLFLSKILERSLSSGIASVSTADLVAENHKLYEDILPGNYENSVYDPDRMVSDFEKAGIPEGRTHAQLLCALASQMRGLIPYAYEGDLEIFTIHAELFVQIYSCYRFAALDEGFPEAEHVRDIIYWFESDNCDIIIPKSVSEKIDPSSDFLRNIVCDADLTDERFLYLSGEYVTDNERGIAAYLNRLSDEQIQSMADTFTEGYRIGFVKAGKPLDKKKTANIRYSLGFERLVRAAVANFEKMGLESVIYRAGSLMLTNGGVHRIGFYGAIPNRQYDYDHKDDIALILDADLVTRRLEVLEDSYVNQKSLANTHAGPAVIEVFGEDPFTPKAKDSAAAHSDKTRKLSVDYAAKASLIVNRFIIGEERSFTIIAYPIPEIGDDFEKIFADTVKLNTLPYGMYENIQQKIIDALDTADHVEIKGKGDNETSLTVNLHRLSDPAKQTNFENCVADVNIPVGEVFTTPLLSGTNGLLHVTKVFLNGLLYKDLKIAFADGMISDYGCANYDGEDKNRKFIKDNILFKRDTLPLGEFAIGTNTTAYRMGRDYGIEGRLPILIGEKTGPHFAVGDTCYSHEEDVAVFNPDGKEIIARENEISAKRSISEKDAYFQCHTDITIPYDEIAYIRAVGPSGSMAIIEDGRFSLPGCEELNIPLDKQ